MITAAFWKLQNQDLQDQRHSGSSVICPSLVFTPLCLSLSPFVCLSLQSPLSQTSFLYPSVHIQGHVLMEGGEERGY